MEPILHLSIPVRDLAESRAFYVDLLGCDLGRVRDDFIDVWFFGMQVSLHAEPDQVRPVEDQGVQHFGVTLDAADLQRLLQRLDGQHRDLGESRCRPTTPERRRSRRRPSSPTRPAT